MKRNDVERINTNEKMKNIEKNVFEMYKVDTTFQSVKGCSLITCITLIYQVVYSIFSSFYFNAISRVWRSCCIFTTLIHLCIYIYMQETRGCWNVVYVLFYILYRESLLDFITNNGDSRLPQLKYSSSSI